MFREKLYIDIHQNLDVELYVQGYGVLSVKHIIDNIARYKHEIHLVAFSPFGFENNPDCAGTHLGELHRLSSLLDVHVKALNMYHLFGDGVKTSCNPLSFKGIPTKEVSNVE